MRDSSDGMAMPTRAPADDMTLAKLFRHHWRLVFSIPRQGGSTSFSIPQFFLFCLVVFVCCLSLSTSLILSPWPAVPNNQLHIICNKTTRKRRKYISFPLPLTCKFFLLLARSDFQIRSENGELYCWSLFAHIWRCLILHVVCRVRDERFDWFSCFKDSRYLVNNGLKKNPRSN